MRVAEDAPNGGPGQEAWEAVEVLKSFVFGHSHKPFNQRVGDMLYFNPGYAGKPRFGQPRSVAVLHCDETGIRAEYKAL